MCFKRQKEIDYNALSKELERKTSEKFDSFVNYLKENKRYKFLLDTMWFENIHNFCYYPLSRMNFQLWEKADENVYNGIKETCEKISDRLRDEKVSIPDVISTMIENSNDFKKFCEEEYARFFVLEPLFGGQTLYCFSCEKEMYPEKLRQDENGGFFCLDITLIEAETPDCITKKINSNNYKIRSMYEWEFRDIYLPTRCKRIEIRSEIELINYETELQRLFIEDTIKIKKNGK